MAMTASACLVSARAVVGAAGRQRQSVRRAAAVPPFARLQTGIRPGFRVYNWPAEAAEGHVVGRSHSGDTLPLHVGEEGETGVRAEGAGTTVVELAAAVTALTLAAAPALAAGDAGGGSGYDPSAGSQLFETVAGVLYTLLVVWFLGRTISRRVNKFTTERVGGGPPPASSGTDEEGSVIIQSDQGKAATPLGALTGAFIAFAISTVLWKLCLKVDDYFDHQTTSTQFTVAKLQITIQTISRGLVYLCTFIFAANGTGLLGLAAAMVVAPDSVKDPVIAPKKRDPLAGVSASKPLAIPKDDKGET
mmetsp:Transcript_17547/g.44918  ORF Transcript_17547/g.44918 Transcript_17547/m.44918 type:complete len:305 (-) Transcript_17547:78-992(-)